MDKTAWIEQVKKEQDIKRKRVNEHDSLLLGIPEIENNIIKN